MQAASRIHSPVMVGRQILDDKRAVVIDLGALPAPHGRFFGIERILRLPRFTSALALRCASGLFSSTPGESTTVTSSRLLLPTSTAAWRCNLFRHLTNCAHTSKRPVRRRETRKYLPGSVAPVSTFAQGSRMTCSWAPSWGHDLTLRKPHGPGARTCNQHQRRWVFRRVPCYGGAQETSFGFLCKRGHRRYGTREVLSSFARRTGRLPRVGAMVR